MEMIAAPVLTLGGLGIFFGVLLAISSKIFHVDKDPRIDSVLDALPGANCGGCGYAGCANLAEAIVQGEAEVTACPVGGAATASAIADIMGVKAGEMEKLVAHVNCRGGVRAVHKYDVDVNYDGIMDCLAATKAGGGTVECSYGCLGLGNCVRACRYDAMFIEDGVAVVHADNCTACGACAKACPRGLIYIVSDKQDVFVSCSSHAKGAELRTQCNIGCIGCMLCVKKCPTGAIAVADNLAYIDYNKCTNCGECAEVCPRKLIVDASESRAKSIMRDSDK